MSKHFQGDCNIRNGMYKGAGGWVESQRWVAPSIWTQTLVMCFQQGTDTDTGTDTGTIHRIDRGGH